MVTSTFQADLRNFLFRSNPVPMFLFDSASLRVLGANDAAVEKYGYTCRELRSMTVRDLRPYSETPALESALLLDHEAPAHSLWTHTTKTGKVCLMSAVDASAWSEARLKLVRSEEIHRSLVEECPFGIYRLNLTTGRFQQVNPVLLRGSGYTFDELSSIDMPSLYVDPGDRDRYLSELLAAGSIKDFETRLRKRNGEVARVVLSGYLCTDSETGHQHIQGYLVDITRQREIEEQLNHSHRMESVGRLAGGVAHDFNNITQSISLSCELALQNTLAPAIESKLLDIMQQTSRAAEITRQLLAYSRRQVLQPRVVNINTCIRKSLAILTRAVGVDVSIDLKLDDTVDHIIVDPEQLTLVLMHLGDNARVAMPHGGVLRVTTTTRQGTQDVHGTTLSDPCAMLIVSDTGIGMNEATQRRIFEPFFSTKNTTLTTGLGLSTVHGIISQSRGRIECDSTVGIGTTFRIYLPFAADRPSITTPHFNGDVDGFRILLAEDDPIVNKHLTAAIRHAGFAIDSVSNGEEALIQFGTQRYDILITDIMMPKLGGVELTNRVRQQKPDMPVILISGFTEEVSALQSLPKDRIAYLQKPFSTPQLVSKVRHLLNSRGDDEGNGSLIDHEQV
jgi:PAS domain S-box-containing protein